MTRTDVGLRAADVYAQVFYELAEQSQIVEEVRGELERLEEIIAGEGDFLRIMSSPSFTTDYKQRLLHNMFAGKVNELTLNFLLTANKHNRMMFLPQMIARFTEIWQAHHGFSVVELTVPQTPSEAELRNASQAIADAMKKKVKLKLNVKPAIIGGAVIRYGDAVIDNSVTTRLHRAVHAIMDRSQGRG